MTEREESDQLPEEAPPDQVVDDAPGERPSSGESAGAAGDEGRATGHHDEPREDDDPEGAT